MINLMKKGIALITLVAFLSVSNITYASNVASIDLELSSSQYLSVADTASLSITGDITIEGWFKVEQLPSTAGSVFALVQKDAANRSYSLNIITTNKLRMNYFSNNSTVTTLDSTNAILVAGDVGNWVHIAITVDVSAQTAVMYKNGSSVAVTQTTTNATSIADTNAPFTIGSIGAGTAQLFDGLIDEVRVWSDIRTGTEISDNYEKELVGNEAGLVGYWKLNNDLLDETANNNDLTNNNSATFSTDVPFVGAVRRIILIE